MTTPDQIRRFLKKRPVGGGRVTCAVETALGVGHAVAEWSMEQLDAAFQEGGTTDPATAIMEACQDFADSDGNPTRFVIRWFGGHDRVLLSLIHKAVPQGESGGSEGVIKLESASPLGALLVANRELMGLVGTLHSRQNAALPQICQSYERAIALITAQLQASMQREAQLAERVRALEAGAGQPRELTQEEREEALRRGEAWRELSVILKGRLGEALDLAIAAGANKLLPAEQKQ